VPLTDDDAARVVAVIAEASRAGSPVAAKDDNGQRDMAAVALRRWSSFERRAKKKPSDMDARVEDLAKGLRDAYEVDRNLVGPLIVDYRWLAERIAAALASSG
jgi:hypothetical protein